MMLSNVGDKLNNVRMKKTLSFAKICTNIFNCKFYVAQWLV